MTLDDFLTKLDSLADSQLITESHLAAWLQISVSKIQKDRVKGNGIPYRKPGGSVRYCVGDVRKYLDQVAYTSTSGYQVEFAQSIDLDDLGKGRPVPFAVVNGEVKDFISTLDQEIDEVVWLLPESQPAQFR